MTSDANSFNDTSASVQAGACTAPVRAYHRKWQSAFDAAEDEENAKKSGAVRTTTTERMKRGWKLQSIPGFFFGPLYYFYLGMWRKGLLIIALVPIIAVVQTITGGGKFFDLLIPVLCMTYAKRDYYKFCTRGETVWRWARFSKNIWTDAALVAASVIACSVGIAALDNAGGDKVSSHVTSDAPLQSAAATSSEDATAPEGTVSISKRPDVKLNPDDYHIIVTSRVNSLRILGLVVNRGSCRLIVEDTNTSLHFGEAYSEYAMCNPIEVTVKTSLGTATATWND